MSRPADGADRDIWIGDLLEAWRSLGLVAPEQRAAAAEALGFDAARLRTARGSVDRAREEDQARAGSAAVDAPAATPARRAVRQTAVAIPSSTIEEEAPAVAEVPSWIAAARPLDEERPAHTTWRPPHLPLLKPHWTRHIMTAISSVPVHEGALDERRLIEVVSSLRPVVALPRRARTTLRRGVQVLIDRGEAMLPFQRDANDLLASLRAVVGPDHLVSAAFEYTPLAKHVVWLRTRRRGPWEPPAAGTPILLVTDLGITRQFGAARGATVSEWLEFAAKCRTTGSPVIALVPRGSAHWPPELRKVFTIVPWDHRTNVAVVLRYLRPAGPRR